jgi:hypothetical protein
MRKIIALALVAIPVMILLTLPVSVILPYFEPPDELGQVRGTIWTGSARWSQPGHGPLDLNWRWRGGRRWRWHAADAGTDLAGTWRPGAVTMISDLSGRLDLARVDLQYWLHAVVPTGFLQLEIDTARLQSGQVPHLTGRAVWEEARLEGSIHERLGRIGIELEPGENRQQARIQSLEPAPIQVRGRIEADAEEYEVDLWLRASSDRPDLVSQIGMLGERQPDGQVRLRMRGALGW